MTDTVATLWIGPKLSFLERLSLKSFHDAGQTPILYLYDDVEDPPDYADIRDAREVMPDEFTQKYWAKNQLDDPRIHSDIFRVLLMRKTDHIWIDADVYALRPHVADNGYLFAPRKKRFIPNGVLRLPKDSPALLAMEDFVGATGRLPPWWSKDQRNLFARSGSQLSFENLPVGVTGLEAFGYFIFETGEHLHARPFGYLYPILARHSVTLLETPTPYDVDKLRHESMSLHLYATAIRRRLVRSAHGTPPLGSLLHLLCHTHGIDMNAFPIEHSDTPEAAEQVRRYNRIGTT